MNHQLNRIPAAVAVLCVAFLGSIYGCSGGEFRAEQKESKVDIQNEIDRVTSNKNIPEPAKPGIINGLKKKMEQAK